MQPLTQDWRLKVLAARKAAQQPTPSASSQAIPDLEDLSRGLPASWQAMWDTSSQQVYYGNTETKVRPALLGQQ